METKLKLNLLDSFKTEIRERAVKYLDCVVMGDTQKADYIWDTMFNIASLAKKTLNNVEPESEKEEEEEEED